MFGQAAVIKLDLKGESGFTLLELVITLSVLAILVMGTIPLTQNAVKREKEMRLRETLRMVRNAIDEFKRDTIGACPQGALISGNQTVVGGNIDRRSAVGAPQRGAAAAGWLELERGAELVVHATTVAGGRQIKLGGLRQRQFDLAVTATHIHLGQWQQAGSQIKIAAFDVDV